MEKPIIVIAGATATGKTGAAIMIAKKIGGEIISADSMQIYKYMNIGTAKPTEKEMAGIRHYMIDELFPDEQFNIAVFKAMAEQYIEEIHAKGKIPIIVGGTGFYINSVIRQTQFEEVVADPEIREFYSKIANERGSEYLYQILRDKDPLSAKNIHPNNVKRVIRAIEYFETIGKSIADHNINEKSKKMRENVCFIILDMDRTLLYERINNRVSLMIENGLIEEVQSLLDRGYNENLVSMQGIGYKEIIKYINGSCSLDEAIYEVKKNSRNYAKRQVTWFKHQTEGVLIDAVRASSDTNHLIEIINKKTTAEELCNQ